MVICQVDSLASQTKIRQSERTWECTVPRSRDHRDANYLQWHPSDLGGTMLDTAFDHRAEFTALGILREAPRGTAPTACPLRLVKVGITCPGPRPPQKPGLQ